MNPKLDLSFQTDEQNGGEKECYADLMLTAKGNFTLKSLLTGTMAIDKLLRVSSQDHMRMLTAVTTLILESRKMSSPLNKTSRQAVSVEINKISYESKMRNL